MSNASTEQFVRFLLAHEQNLYCYAFSLVTNPDDAKDVVQEAAVTMWQQFGEFDTSRPFAPWASRFVYFTAQNFLRQRRRLGVSLSQEALDAIASEADDFLPAYAQARIKALGKCLERLSAPSRALMADRYQHGLAIKKIAELRKINIHTLYKAFHKIRLQLQGCIERSLAAQERG